MTEEQPQPKPQQQYEKGEKEEEKHEKEHEKDHEKEQEKSWDEKWRRDPLSAIVWAAILIWAGVVLLASNMGILQNWASALGLEQLEVWSAIFAGAGILVLLEAAVRLAVPEYRRPVMGTIIWGLVLIGIGLSDIISWSALWAIILILIGLSILLRGFFPRQRE